MSTPSASRVTFVRILRQSTGRPAQLRCLHTPPSRPSLVRRSVPRHSNGGYQQTRQRMTFAEGSKKLLRENPISTLGAIVCILVGAYTIIYANYTYQNYIIAAFHKYPEPVAKKLRRAIYYSKTDVQPQEALKYFKQALQIAEEMQMDPLSDEILGVKFEVAGLMERIQQFSKAIQVLEIVRRDCLIWLEKFGSLEHNKQKRTMILKKLVGMSIKLGELYSQPVIYDRDMAESRLVWAVETLMQERQRRDALNVSEEEEGEWASNSEFGAAMEALAHTYEEKDQHHLATPLFLRALSLQGTSTCHSVILMNNLASSLAQQSPRAAAAAQAFARSRTINSTPAESQQPPLTREQVIDNASTWAKKALDVAAGIKPPARDEECDTGCAVATHNLGEFAEMLKDFAEARKRYQEAIALSRAIGFEEGVKNSSERLDALPVG